MLPPRSGGMVWSIVPTDWILRQDTPRRRGSPPPPPCFLFFVDSNLISGPLGPSWRLPPLPGAPRSATSGSQTFWRPVPSSFLVGRCGRKPRAPTPYCLGPYQGTVSHPGPAPTDRILCEPTQRPSLTPLLSPIFCLLGLPDGRRRTPRAPCLRPARTLSLCVFSPLPGLGCRWAYQSVMGAVSSSRIRRIGRGAGVPARFPRRASAP